MCTQGAFDRVSSLHLHPAVKVPMEVEVVKRLKNRVKKFRTAHSLIGG